MSKHEILLLPPPPMQVQNDVVVSILAVSTMSCPSLSMELDESTESRIQRLITEHPVIIFTRSSCCMCHVMKNLLATIGVNPTVINLDDDEIDALPSPSAPAAFIGGTFIGGLESLVALHGGIDQVRRLGPIANYEAIKAVGYHSNFLALLWESLSLSLSSLIL
ncbi:hypothetical protein Ahy_A07g033230 isoform C [Arachis hypogaea]|uniref:Glutaredoxin domain-containing protein n=1 Tax=Arachis hypogaea TaxID=3818 RepID=A0A445C8N3_ARAHY|nr:hypothetical protein Ahy_A07g033230 isoform C [Arachis hypogaea]